MRGDLLFYHEHGPIVWLIQLGTHGPFNHVAIDCGDGSMIEAKGKNVHRTRTNLNNLTVARLRVTDDQWAAGDLFLKSTLGAPYDVIDFLLNIYVLVFPHGKFPKTPAAFDCSELAATYLFAIGYPLPAAMQHDDDRQHVSPNDLARWLGVERMKT